MSFVLSESAQPRMDKGSHEKNVQKAIGLEGILFCEMTRSIGYKRDYGVSGIKIWSGFSRLNMIRESLISVVAREAFFSFTISSGISFFL